ncbi:MAG: hypothetical protein K8T26_11120 [Lentisphaerae bacterium]|nr:hypothetical protein [Lentisphaerota bacterium]
MFEPDQGEAPPASAPQTTDGQCPDLGHCSKHDTDTEQQDRFLDALAKMLVQDMMRLHHEYGLTPKQAMDHYAGELPLPVKGARV